MKDIQHFFRLSRPLNVGITLLAFALAAYIACFRSFLFVQLPEFWPSLLCIGLITATGYWINDVYDFRIDRINKPGKVIVPAQLSVKKVLTAYFVTLGATLLFSALMLPLIFTLINIGTAFALFLYAAWLKRTTVVGNLLVASLTATVIWYAGLLFTVRPAVWWMLMFAFEVTFLREVTKDIEDMKGDLRFHLQTLPIRLGIRRAKWVLAAAYVVFILSCWVPFAFEYVWYHQWNLAYAGVSFAGVQIPAALLLWQMQKSYKPTDFGGQSLWLKLLIFPGILSVFFLH